MGKLTANRGIREEDRRVEASGSEVTSRQSLYYSAEDSITALERETSPSDQRQQASAQGHGSSKGQALGHFAGLTPIHSQPIPPPSHSSSNTEGFRRSDETDYQDARSEVENFPSAGAQRR